MVSSRSKGHPIQPDEPAKNVDSNLLVRAQLMTRLRQLIGETGLSQSAVAKLLGVKQPRIAEIMAMKVEYFSADTLLKYLEKMGDQITIVSEQAGSPSKALSLIQSWLDEEPDYDINTWPVLKANLEANRIAERKLFRE